MDINQAKQILKQENLTCIIFKDNNVYTSKKRGVKPLLELIDSCENNVYIDGGAVDKVVGKAAAFLYVILKIKKLHVGVISKKALKVLKDNNIEVTYDDLVPYIVNRNKDGRCPMETAVWNIEDSGEAIVAIREMLRKLIEKN